MNRPGIWILLAFFALLSGINCSNLDDRSTDLSSTDDDATDDETDDSDNDTDSEEDDGTDDTDDSDNDTEEGSESDNDVIEEGEDPDTGTEVDPLFMQISLDAPVGTTATIHEYNDSWDSEFKISFDADPTDIRCIVEGIELGLYGFNDTFKLNYNIPEGLCKFTRVIPYAFYRRLAGTGPTSFKITTTDGVPVLSDVVNANPDITVQLDPDGSPICTTNYVDADPAVDCCEGEYTLTERVIDTDDATDTTSITHSEWAGEIANCLAGPAMATQDLTSHGYPRATLINMEGIGLNRDYEINSPLSQELSTNLYIANYFDISSSFDADGEFVWATAPTAIFGEEVHGYPFYEFQCLDEADDYIHRIRVLIRSWSSEEQYALGEDGAFDAGADGDGEAYFLQQPLLDLYGWFESVDWDLMTEYPGDDL